MKEFTSLYDVDVKHVDLPKGIVYPVKYSIIRRMSPNNTYGMVRRKANGKKKPHQGWDFYAPIGYRCYAISDGVIADVRNRGALGLHILLKFEFDIGNDGSKEILYATYCHLSKATVKKGQVVKMGDVVGTVGDSGNAKGMRGSDSHLHFEIRTSLWAGLGLGNRFSPLTVFQDYPLKEIHVTDKSLI